MTGLLKGTTAVIAVWFGILGVAGLVVVFTFRRILEASPLAFGPHTIALFLPLVCAFAMLSFLLMVGRLRSRTDCFLPLILFVLVSLPLVSLLPAPIQHLHGDDSERYSQLAHRIVENRTLWGSEDSADGTRSSYTWQPGYRYFVALHLLLFGQETRLTQVLDLFVYLLATLLLLRQLEVNGLLSPRSRWVLSSFLVLSSPYAAKDIILSYSEWLAISLFFFFLLFALKDKYIPAVVCLGLTSFVRQNLLLFSPLVLMTMCAHDRGWRRYIPVFAAIYLLPLWHNLYYAGEFRLLVKDRPIVLQGYSLRDILALLVYRIPPYFGFGRDVGKPSQVLIALLFAPLGTTLVLWHFFTSRLREMVVLAVVLVCLIGPTVIFGTAVYPRFEWVNLTLALMYIYGMRHYYLSPLEN